MSEAEKFVRGNDRLKRALSDPATSDRAGAIREEMARTDLENAHVDPEGGVPDRRDARKAFRITVDVLAEPGQIPALKSQFAEMLCQAPGDHPPPCRFAWSISADSAVEGDEEGASFTRAQAEYVFNKLAPVEVWPAEAANQSLARFISEEEELL